MNNFRVALLQEIRLIIQCMQNRKKKLCVLGMENHYLKPSILEAGVQAPSVLCGVLTP